jgi:hypothetical protein
VQTAGRLIPFILAGADLLALDLATGELVRKVSVTNPINSAFQGISYNYRDSTLYGIAVGVAGLSVKLAKLDPFTGFVTPLSVSPVATSCNALAGTALDPVRGIFYFVTNQATSNHLVGVDLHSGGPVSDPAIGMDSADRFGPMEFNCRDSSLYGLAGNFTHGRKLARIDPASGTITYLSDFYLVADTLLNEQVTIDPFQNIFYFEAMDHTYRGGNLDSGILVSYSHISPLPGTYFTGFLFNHNCYSHAPSVIGEGKKDPELSVFPNPVYDKLTIRSAKPLFTIEILDFTGKSVMTEKCFGLKEVQADLSGFPEGFYVVKINNESSSVSSKLVKTALGNQSGH